MVGGVCGKAIISVKLLQSLKTSLPIFTTLLGIVMEAMLPRKLQPENAKSPMLVQSLGNVKEVRLLQPRKASDPIDVTLLGMMTELRLLHPWKALFPMLFTPSGIVMEARPLQPKNALSAIAKVSSGKVIDVFSGIVPLYLYTRLFI